MTAAVHPVSLEQIVFTRTVVVSVPGHTPTPDTIGAAPENQINVAKVEGFDRKFQVSMRCLLNKEGATTEPYVIDMEAFATLNVDASLSDDDAHRGVLITGHSVLYGAIREAVAWITGRHPYGQLMLGLSVLPTASPPDQDPKKQ